MTAVPPDTAERLRDVLERATLLPPSRRAAALDELCTADPALRDQAASLLRALETAGHLLEPQPPALPSLTGQQLAGYTIGPRVGEGGMGVVYRATDDRLGRTVAVKSLPQSFASDPDRRARLQHEARALAAINHPNIATIHGIEDSPHGPLLVLEFVEGQTLAQRLLLGPLQRNDARKIATQVLRALEAAHGAAVIHRDIKPANIMLTPSGDVKVLDFGVSRYTPLAPAPLETPQALLATRPGSIAGTAAYMSPEQARARPADQRTDLWAFGCVLYEMLTARPAFAGETISDTIAAVLRADPDWSRLPPSVPVGVVRVLRRCLEKDPDRRARSAGDVRLDLEEAWDAPATRAPRGSLARTLIMFGAGAAVGAACFALWWPATPRTSPPPVMRLSVVLPESRPIRAGQHVALSPDGRTLAYCAGVWNAPGPALFLRPLDGREGTPLPGTDRACGPFFSPDGRWIAYWEQHGDSSALMRITREGGPPQRIADGGSYNLGACWMPDDSGTIVFSPVTGEGLRRVHASGGTVTELTTLDRPSEELHAFPSPMPDGVTILFSRKAPGQGWATWRIESLDTRTGDRRVVLDNAFSPLFLSAAGASAPASNRGFLLFCRGNTLMGAPMDRRTLRLLGEPRRLTLGGDAEGAAPISYSASTGEATVLAFVRTGDSSLGTDLAWFTPEGGVETIYRGDSVITTLRLSPDGASVAYSTMEPTPGLWVLDLRRGTPVRICDELVAEFPVWSPDGRHVIFAAGEPGGQRRLMSAPSDGSSPPELLLPSFGAYNMFPTDITRDGRWLAISYTPVPPPATGTDVLLLDLNDKTTRRQLFDTRADRVGLRFNRQGTLAAYTSSESGREEVYVQSFPAMDRKLRVSTQGGYRVVWSRDGTRLCYQCEGNLYAVQVLESPELHVSSPTLTLRDIPNSRQDTGPGDERYLMARPRGGWAPPREIHVEINSIPELLGR